MKTLASSSLLYLILIFLISSCTVEDKISSEYMISQVMGHTNKGPDGAWRFDNKEEFLDHRILNQIRDDKKLKVDVEFLLENDADKKIMFLHTILDFRLIGNEWIFIQGKQLKYKEVQYRSLPNKN